MVPLEFYQRDWSSLTTAYYREDRILFTLLQRKSYALKLNVRMNSKLCFLFVIKLNDFSKKMVLMGF